MIFEPRFCISRLSAAVRKLRKADLSDFIWRWGGKCPKKKCGCKKKPDFWFLGRTFHHFSDPGRELNAGRFSSQQPNPIGFIMSSYVLHHSSANMLIHATSCNFPKKDSAKFKWQFPSNWYQNDVFLGQFSAMAPWPGNVRASPAQWRRSPWMWSICRTRRSWTGPQK